LVKEYLVMDMRSPRHVTPRKSTNTFLAKASAGLRETASPVEVDTTSDKRVIYRTPVDFPDARPGVVPDTLFMFFIFYPLSPSLSLSLLFVLGVMSTPFY
jgi:hypothetical protein